VLLSRARASAVLVGVVIACRSEGSGSERSEPLPAVAPFDRLAGVRLPATVADLAKLRPQTKPSDFGLREAVGEFDVRYFADRAAGSEQQPGPNARVQHIAVEWEQVSEDSAAVLWRSSMERLNATLGMTPECFRAAPSSVAFARWRKQSGAVAYLRWQHSVTGPVRLPGAFSIGFSVDTMTLRPALTGAAATSCADPFRF